MAHRLVHMVVTNHREIKPGHPIGIWNALLAGESVAATRCHVCGGTQVV